MSKSDDTHPVRLWAQGQTTASLRELAEKTEAAYRTVRFKDPETAELLQRDLEDINLVLVQREGLALQDRINEVEDIRPVNVLGVITLIVLLGTIIILLGVLLWP